MRLAVPSCRAVLTLCPLNLAPQTGTDRITPCWRTSPPPRSCKTHMKCLTSKSYCHVRGGGGCDGRDQLL